jgi:hypothetical protein
MHHFNEQSLAACFHELDGTKAVGIDGVTKAQYAGTAPMSHTPVQSYANLSGSYSLPAKSDGRSQYVVFTVRYVHRFCGRALTQREALSHALGLHCHSPLYPYTCQSLKL